MKNPPMAAYQIALLTREEAQHKIAELLDELEPLREENAALKAHKARVEFLMAEDGWKDLAAVDNAIAHSAITASPAPETPGSTASPAPATDAPVPAAVPLMEVWGHRGSQSAQEALQAEAARKAPAAKTPE